MVGLIGPKRKYRANVKFAMLIAVLGPNYYAGLEAWSAPWATKEPQKPKKRIARKASGRGMEAVETWKLLSCDGCGAINSLCGVRVFLEESDSVRFWRQFPRGLRRRVLLAGRELRNAHALAPRA